MTEQEDPKNEFLQIAESEGDTSLIREFIEFLATNKKWWLGPIVVVLLGIGAILFLTATPLAPFIYTLF